jgi:hypothetical protein
MLSIFRLHGTSIHTMGTKHTTSRANPVPEHSGARSRDCPAGGGHDGDDDQQDADGGDPRHHRGHADPRREQAWAPVHPIRGAPEVARLVTALLGRSGAVLAVESVNGRAGLALRRAGRAVAVAVVSVSITGAEVTAVWFVLNPDKLHGWHHR